MIQETQPFATLATWLSSSSFRISKHFWCTSLLTTYSIQSSPKFYFRDALPFHSCQNPPRASNRGTGGQVELKMSDKSVVDASEGQIDVSCRYDFDWQGTWILFRALWLPTMKDESCRVYILTSFPRLIFQGDCSDIGARWEVSKPTATLWQLYSNCSHGSTNASVLMAGNAISHK